MKGLPHANHFYQDTDFGKPGVKLLMNEFYVTSEDMVLNTVLGSCVSACIRDPGTGIGGMNHFMLPDESGDPSRDSSDAMRYGAYAMEVLINELIKGGARRSGLEAKVFGGAAVLKRMHTLNIGEDNSRFVRRYLALENIRIVAEDLEGEHPRKVCFMPATGRVMVRKLPLDVRVADPQARTASIALEQRERAMAEQMRALGERRSQSASGTAEVFGRGDAQTRNAAVLARPAAVAPRVELFIRRPAAPAAKPSGKPGSATSAAANPFHEAI